MEEKKVYLSLTRMKTTIHPNWHEEAKIICACGNTFSVGSTVAETHVDVCYSCHPFYTGTMKFLDSAGRVDAFKAKMAGAGKKVMSKTEKRENKRLKKLAEEASRPESLAELRKETSN